MARPIEGHLTEIQTSAGVTYTARITVNGKRRSFRIGSTAEGWTRAKAEDELSVMAAQLRRGHVPASNVPIDEPIEVPTFHVFATEWLQAKAPQLAPTTIDAYRLQLVNHLLPVLADYRLDEIDVKAVDDYREAKVAEGLIAHSYVNATITLLGSILDVADERDLISRNPVRVNPRNRRIQNVRKPKAIYLDRAEHISALLNAAGAMDREARADRRALNRRALLATLVFGDLRIGEAFTLRWRDVDLANGRLRVNGTKTSAADRDLVMLPALRDELLAHKATATFDAPEDHVFGNGKGNGQDRNNTRDRVFKPAIRRANIELIAGGFVPIPIGEGRGKDLTQHGLRHTHISLRCALGHDPAHIARDVGHADLSVTFRIYTHLMDLAPENRSSLAKLVNGDPIPDFKSQIKPSSADSPLHESSETLTRPAGFEPATSRTGTGHSIH